MERADQALFTMHFLLIVFPYCAPKKRVRLTSFNPRRAKAKQALAPFYRIVRRIRCYV
jgi:hypothetical protein